VRPTRLPVLLAVVLVVGVLTWALARTAYGQLPPLPVIAPISLLLLALVEGFSALSVRDRLAGRPGTRPILPLQVARYAALGKAGAAAGGLFTGLFGGLLGYLLPELGKPAYSRDAWVSAAGVVTSLILVAAALALERACRVRRPPGPQEPARPA
jgi:uncharacterized membrane protein